MLAQIGVLQVDPGRGSCVGVHAEPGTGYRATCGEPIQFWMTLEDKLGTGFDHGLLKVYTVLEVVQNLHELIENPY